MEKEETVVMDQVDEPTVEPSRENVSGEREDEESSPATPHKLRKKVSKEPSQGGETRKTRSKTRPAKKHSEKDATHPASSAKSLVQPIPPGIESDDISGPSVVEKTSEKKTKKTRRSKERKERMAEEEEDAPESDAHAPKLTRKLSKLFSRTSKLSESGNSGIVMQDSSADMKGKAPKKGKKSASKDIEDKPRKGRRNRAERKKNTVHGKASQPIPQSMESISSDNFKEHTDKMSKQKLARRSSEWFSDNSGCILEDKVSIGPYFHSSQPFIRPSGIHLHVPKKSSRILNSELSVSPKPSVLFSIFKKFQKSLSKKNKDNEHGDDEAKSTKQSENNIDPVSVDKIYIK